MHTGVTDRHLSISAQLRVNAAINCHIIISCQPLHCIYQLSLCVCVDITKQCIL